MSAFDRRELGKTGIQVTHLSAGGHFTNGPLAHEDIPRRVKELHHMIDHGMNYFDVQWDPEEEAMAEVLQTRRDEVSIAWPLHGVTQRGGDVTAEYIIDYCNDHRQRYGLDRVEVLLWIGLELDPDTEDQALAEVQKAVDALKADGFCEHFGFSCHASPAKALHAIERFDVFEVMMVPYCPLHPAAGQELLRAAREKGVGVVGMKPFGGGGGFFNKVWAGEIDLPEMAQWKGSPAPYEAAIRWVLQDEYLDCTVPGLHSIEQVDEIVAAASQPFTEADEALLATFMTALDESGAEVQLRGNLGGSPRSWE